MSDVTSSDPRTQFAARPPSTSWEGFPLEDAPQCLVWTWFKPSHVPSGLILTIPDETFQTVPRPDLLTTRKLLRAAGVDPRGVAMWSLYGVGYDGLFGTSPFLDQPIPAPAPGVDRQIVVCIHPPVMVPPAMSFPPVISPMNPATAAQPVANTELHERIGTDWNASLHLEKEMDSLRKQLAAMSAKLNSLNRDLTAEESRQADRQDHDDWRDARRWLRDAAGKVSRFMKECDVGETVYVGKKSWFEQIYEQVVIPRQPMNGLDQVRHEFETHRKNLQMLVHNMRATLSSAGADGERRAQKQKSDFSHGENRRRPSPCSQSAAADQRKNDSDGRRA